MRLQAALLFLFSSCIPSTQAIYPDEVNHIDYHHALLGLPTTQSTFFLKPSSATNASLLYTLSEKAILGAVNPRDGSVIWRQNVSSRSGSGSGSSSAENGNASGLLRASDGVNAVVSAVGDYLSSWSALDGKLIWENWFSNTKVVDLELLELEDTNARAESRDSIALFSGDAGVVRRIDGESGNVKWEYEDDSGDVPFQVSSSPTDIYYISLQSALLKGYKIKITTLDSLTGRQTYQQTLTTENDVTGPESIPFVGANTAAPIIAWTDKAGKALKVNVIGTKQVTTANIANSSGEEIKSVNVHAAKKLHSRPHFLVDYETESSSWAEVYHIDLKLGTVTKAYDLPRVQERSVFAASNQDANVYFTRITQSEMTVVSSASHGILGRWALKDPSPQRALHAVSEVVGKGDAVAVRSAALLASGDWELVRNGQTEWTRYEALAGALAAAWAETGDKEELVHQLEVEGHESVYGAYAHRVKRHINDLQYLSDWLRELPKRILTSFLTDEVSNLDGFGIAKSVVVATENGRVFAIDSGNHGSVSWSVKAAETETWNVKAIITQPGVATVYTEDGSTVVLNVSSGEIIRRTPASAQVHSIAVVDNGSAPVTVSVKEDGSPAEAVDGPGFLVTLSADGRVLGWSAKDNKIPVWEFVPPQGQKIVRATSRPVHDPVASIGKVLGDRSVLYKYLNTNLALITAVGDNSATFYLLDAISGVVLHATTQTHVDTNQPIASAISENWFAYSFWGDAAQPSDAKGYQLVISELYESPHPNERGPLGSASNYSSVHDSNTPTAPHVVSQAFIIPEPISHMAVTQTRQGITTRQLLCVLPSSNSIVGIPRYVLDPRRPVDRDPTATELEEGLIKYAPFLEFDGRWFLTHARDVRGVANVLTIPTLLESTGLIFAFGGDIFGSRVAPSQAFDVLGKGFSKIQLVLTVVALAIGVVILSPIARKKQINTIWKAAS